MAFKLKTQVKPKVAPEAETTIQVDPQTKGLTTPAAMIDEIGKLEAEEECLNGQLMEDPRMVQMLKVQKERARLENALVEKVSTPENIGQKLVVTGAVYVGEISAAPNKRTVKDKDRVVELLEETQEGLALQLAGFKLTDLDKYLNPLQLGEVLEEVREGKRKLKVESI